MRNGCNHPVAGGWVFQRLSGPILLLTFLMLGVSLLFLEDLRISIKKVLTGGNAAAGFRATISGTVLPASAVRCNRLTLPAMYYNESQGPYNPATVRHPSTGEWLLLYTYDEVWFGISEYARTGNYLEGRMRSHPLLIKLGNGTLPSMSKLATVSMLELDEGFEHVKEEFGADLYKAADWRPFAWKGDIYLGHWIGFLPAQERMAIAKLDMEAGIVRYVHRFSHLSDEIESAQHPDMPPDKQTGASLRVGPFQEKKDKAGFKREKNWGFVEEEGALLVYYALLPCTVVLQFDTTQPDGVSLRSRTCYDDKAAIIRQQTGLDILDFEMHSSGNPVPWDIEGGQEHKEYLSMLHVKKGDYAHWAVRINRATHRITHISAGPVLKARDYRNEGFLPSALVVGSFHVLETTRDGGLERFLRILYGEGDRYGCWVDVAADAIVWHEMLEGDASPVQQGSAAAPGPQSPSHSLKDMAPRLSSAPAPAQAPSSALPHSQPQPKQARDTSMGRLEHRLDTESQQGLKTEGQQGSESEDQQGSSAASKVRASNYDAWVHGDPGQHPSPDQSAQKAWGSGSLQPRT